MIIPFLKKASERNIIIVSLGLSMIILVGLGIYANTYTYRYKRSMENTTEKAK